MLRTPIIPELYAAFTVLSEAGLPLSDAHILGGLEPTISDQNGRARVRVLFPNSKIRISHIGYKTQEVAFNQLGGAVYLQSETNTLPEVVITAPPANPTPPKNKTPWYIWAGLGISVVGLIATLSQKESTSPPALAKPAPRKKKKQPLKVTI